MVRDYTVVTEVPGGRATTEQLARLYHRYHTAAQYCEGKQVLEVACGAGLGLGYLARKAGKVVGGDYMSQLLQIAQGRYNGRVRLAQLDAHALPFGNATFDVVILFEAIYYLADPAKFLIESHRVLGNDGLLLICTVNKDWSEFARSALSTTYFSVPELHTLLTEHGFDAEFFAAFPASATSVKHKAVAVLRRVAIALNVVPMTLQSRELFKRLFYGALSAMPPEVQDGMAEVYPLLPIPHHVPDDRFKVLYVAARARSR